jgi:CBS domain containing-hemolysin-like protein
MLDYVLIIAALCLAGFHGGTETGFYCLSQLRLRLRVEAGDRHALALQRLVGRPQLFISTVLVGTNLGIYAATVLCTQKLRDYGMTTGADFWSSIILPPIFLICADMTPKSLFQYHADTLMYRMVWPLRVSEVVFYPFSFVLRWVSRVPQYLLRHRIVQRTGAVTSDSFRFYLSEGAAHGELTSYQRTMAENILRLKSVPVETTMTPLRKTVMIREDATPEELSRLLRAHRYSRFPVWRGSREHVVGTINVLDVVSAERPDVRSLARAVLSVPRGTSVRDALSLLRRVRQQFAVVTDESQGAVGIVTAKDLVEEIVGELQAW